MELVVDANIIVAGFLRSATTRQLLLDERLTLFAPEHMFIESERVLTSSRLRKKIGGLSQAQVRSILNQLAARISILPAPSYQHCLAKALRLAPHTEDAPYLALALHLRIPVWSNDAALKEQSAVAVYSTQKLLELLGS